MPTSALRSADTVRPRLRERLPRGTRVHAMLAADLALDGRVTDDGDDDGDGAAAAGDKKHAVWNAVVPSREAVAASLPLAWADARLHGFLPGPAQALLGRQQAKFARDWAAVEPALAALSAGGGDGVTRAEYMYFWLLVNTRSFYHVPARPGAASASAREDRMVLQPVADLFNHDADAAAGIADSGGGGAVVAFDAAGFSVAAGSKGYASGEEVHICYGRHGSDVLLVEYGFVPGKNRWDEVGLDEAVLPELGEAQRELLEEVGFLGNYVLDAETVCYRTQVALRLLCVPVDEWKRFVEEGEDGGEVVQQKVDRLLVAILTKFRAKIEGRIQELGRVEFGQPCQREMLALRWRQILALVDRTIERLQME